LNSPSLCTLSEIVLRDIREPPLLNLLRCIPFSFPSPSIFLFHHCEIRLSSAFLLYSVMLFVMEEECPDHFARFPDLSRWERPRSRKKSSKLNRLNSSFPYLQSVSKMMFALHYFSLDLLPFSVDLRSEPDTVRLEFLGRSVDTIVLYPDYPSSLPPSRHPFFFFGRKVSNWNPTPFLFFRVRGVSLMPFLFRGNQSAHLVPSLLYCYSAEGHPPPFFFF